MGKLKLFLQFGLLACVAAALVFVLATRYPNYRRLVGEEAQINEEIAQKQKEADLIRRDIDSAGTDAFVEKMARERLGLVYEDEFRLIIDY